MDTITTEQRSKVMSKIKSKNTSIEMTVRKILHKQGYRYKLYDPRIIGRPDLYFPKYKTAVFINGCFWHRHSLCKFAYTPKSNQEYWDRKFENNLSRDEKIYLQLNEQNIKVIIIWECRIKRLKYSNEIDTFLADFKNALENEKMNIEI